ncbi:hypothetical protein FJTKL_04012 [Diaporthe vaccinii]|uniref:Uncharacterized protein n=1 Tax=Diaporthe vaccinii TaxID=105482 RepID=A0ABR4DUW4_9PEZI
MAPMILRSFGDREIGEFIRSTLCSRLCLSVVTGVRELDQPWCSCPVAAVFQAKSSSGERKQVKMGEVGGACV